jgi:mannose-6-phosphate isomerase-like protein (cupin superfamily)
MSATAAGVKIVDPTDGKEGFLGSIGVRFMIDGFEADERFSLVEHPMSPRALAAPLHLHTREDEYSFVLEGRMGALLGDDVVEAGPGDLVFKPRNQWHTFWNAGDEPCRILEIISPAGFERFFQELVDMGGSTQADPDAFAQLRERYGLEMQPETVPELLERFGLRIGEPSPAAGRRDLLLDRQTARAMTFTARPRLNGQEDR